MGLVLSGGGARGAAHVGVLKVLEELGVPIDLITGTSMGAVVGGLYAAGASPEELETLLSTIDWADAFDDRTARRHQTFRRKQDDLNFLTQLKLGLKRTGIAIPLGLIQRQKLDNLLRVQTLPAHAIRDFDQLPIAFRAVATDIETGKAVVLRGGDLAASMSASMAIPGVFAPVEIDGRLLVDGGIANNIPVDIARQMGADVVIAVDVASPTRTRDELTSALAIADQMVRILMLRATREQLSLLDPAVDVLIRPELREFSNIDFERASQVVQRGVEAARTRQSALQARARPTTSRGSLRAWKPPVIDEIRVVSDSVIASHVLEERLDLRTGEPLAPDQLLDELRRLYGLDTFQTVSFSLEEVESQTQLTIRAKEKPWGPHYLRFGLNLEEDFNGDNNFNLAVNYTFNPVNRLGAEWRNEVQIGEQTRLLTEFFQPIGYENRYFIAPTLSFDRFQRNFFADGDRVAEYRIWAASAGLDFGRQLGDWGELRTGIRYTRGRASPDLAEFPGFPRSNFRQGSYFVRFAYDTLDNTRFPRAGAFALMGVEFIPERFGADRSIERIRFAVDKVLSFGENTFVLGARYDTIARSRISSLWAAF